MSEPTKININGIEFITFPIPAIEAFKIKTFFIKKVAPLAGGTIETFLNILKTNQGNTDSILDKNISTEQIGKSLVDILIQLEENELLSLIKRLLQKTQCIFKGEDGKLNNLSFESNNFETSFNIVFSENLSSVYKLIYEIIKITYKDFFLMIGNIGNKLKTFTSNIINPSIKKFSTKSEK